MHLEGFDWSNVGLPDGWGRDEMLSLGFAAAAEDLVLHGPTGRGKTHVATALGIDVFANIVFDTSLSRFSTLRSRPR